MNASELSRYNDLYQQHLTNLKLQGKRSSTIDAYSRAVRRIAQLYNGCPDTLITDQLKHYLFNAFALAKVWRARLLDAIQYHPQLWLPKGLQRVRDYGFLRGQARLLLCRIQLLLLGEFYLQPQSKRVSKSKAVRACPCCQHEMACVGITRPR